MLRLIPWGYSMPIIRVNVENKDGRGRKIPAPNALRDVGSSFSDYRSSIG